MGRLQGKYILITGASQGLGRQLALDFACEGAAGIAIVARNQQALKQVKEEILHTSRHVVLAVAADLTVPGEIERVMQQVKTQLTAQQPQTKVLTIAADLTKPEAIERVVATTLNEFNGRLDVLVNNASTIGATPMPYLLDYPLEDFRNVIDTNLTAPFLLIKKVLPAMCNIGGSIINVTSDAGITGYRGWGAYGISKFGIEGMSQTWAAELAGSGVRLNWVDPGDMNTAMHRAAEPDEDPHQWANPADVTDIFIYLASNESKQVHGQRFEAQTEVELSNNSQIISSIS
jgi:NAD(P)-dependent dehydrogenase (short-subunit alcohol dehydrogenase family)